MVCLLCVPAGLAAGQGRFAVETTRERLVAVVPLTGAGTADDPRRPLFAPKPGERTAIEGYSWVGSDDGKLAIVEFVADSGEAFKHIVEDARTLKAFRRGRDRKEDVERELRRFRRDYRADRQFGGMQ